MEKTLYYEDNKALQGVRQFPKETAVFNLGVFKMQMHKDLVNNLVLSHS